MPTLIFPYPLSLNRFWMPVTTGAGKHAMVPTPEAEEWKAVVKTMCVDQGVTKPFEGRVSVFIRIYPHRPKDHAKRQLANPEFWDDSVQCIDIDNARKALYDAMKGTVFLDDAQVFRDGGMRMEPVGEACMVVVVKPYIRIRGMVEEAQSAADRQRMSTVFAERAARATERAKPASQKRREAMPDPLDIAASGNTAAKPQSFDGICDPDHYA